MIPTLIAPLFFPLHPTNKVAPAVPVVLGHAVLDGDDGVAVDPVFPEVAHLGGRQLVAGAPFELVDVLVGVVEFAGGGVEGYEDVLAGAVAGFLDGLEDAGEGFLVGAEVGGEAALVAHVGAHAFALEDLAEVVEHLGAHAEGFGEGGGSDGHDHELLEVDAVVGVAAAVEDVHHGDGQGVAAHAAEVAVELLARLLGSGLGAGQADAEDGVGAEARLVLRAVELDHLGVDGFLLADEHALQLFVEDGVDVVDGLEDAFAEVLALVAVAQFAGFVHARGGSARYGGAAHGALVGVDVDFHCGVAATVENLTAPDSYNITHILKINWLYIRTRLCYRNGDLSKLCVQILLIV